MISIGKCIAISLANKNEAPISKLNQWTFDKIKDKNNHQIKNGLICLKGGDLKEELRLFNKNVDIYNISDFFSEEFFKTKKILHYSV